MYLVMMEDDLHLSEDSWKTMCSDDIDGAYVLYEVDSGQILEGVETEEATGICDTCATRLTRRAERTPVLSD